MRKTKWLNRQTILLPYWTVVFTQEEFDAAVAHGRLMKPGIDSVLPFVNPGAHAMTHVFTNAKGDCVVIVAMPLERLGTPGWIALAAHEAQHVVSAAKEQYSIGREEELDAYLIQCVVGEIMSEAVIRQRSGANARSKSKKAKR